MNCPTCESPRIDILFTLFDHLFRTTSDRFFLCRCRACEIKFIWPTIAKKDLARHYPEKYWVDPVKQQMGFWGKLSEAYRRIALFNHVRFARPIVKNQKRRNIPIRILDVGCGDGLFLSELGIDPCVGLDISFQAVQAAKFRRVDVVQGSLDRHPFAEHSFSLITMYHVLEHFSPASIYLDAAKKLLAPDGDLIVQVPNVNSYQAKLFKERWAGYDAPRHLIHYSPKTLHRTLSRSGFKVIRQTHFSLRDNAPMFAMSIASGLYPPACNNMLPGTRALIADLAFLGITTVSLPYTLLECCVGHGATVMIHAKPM